MHEPAEYFDWAECDRCGLAYLSPPVPEQDIGRFYVDYLPHRGPSAWGIWSWIVAASEAATDRARLATLRRAAPVHSTSAVLDVGCGRPTFLRRVAHATRARTVGTDTSDDGWRTTPDRWTGLELHAGELESLDLQGPFTHITMWHALEHLYRPLDTLRYLRSLVTAKHPAACPERSVGALPHAPSAARGPCRLVIEVPDYDSITRREFGGYWAGYHTPRHTAAYTPATLRALLERAGWRLEKQYQWGTLDPWLLIWLSHGERAGHDFSGPMQSRFPAFLAGKVMALPLTLQQRRRPLGIQTAIAVAA